MDDRPPIEWHVTINMDLNCIAVHATVGRDMLPMKAEMFFNGHGHLIVRERIGGIVSEAACPPAALVALHRLIGSEIERRKASESYPQRPDRLDRTLQ